MADASRTRYTEDERTELGTESNDDLASIMSEQSAMMDTYEERLNLHLLSEVWTTIRQTTSLDLVPRGTEWTTLIRKSLLGVVKNADPASKTRF